MTYQEDRRPDPEELLQWVQEKEKREDRGRLKVFLGYASGVGKSYRMLDEGRRRKERGQDVVVGALQSQRQKEAEPLLCGMEIVSPRDELDMAAVLGRKPQVCLVDELAHDNPPGSRHLKRWQDVEELLEAGITVITAVNIQHVEELQPTLAPFIRVTPKETVPKAFLHTAEEIVLVDVSSDALRQRREGEQAVLHEKLRAAQILQEPTHDLSELREVALLFAAVIVDKQLEDYVREQGIERLWCAHERVMVCVTSRNDAGMMIETGRQIADRFHGELYVVTVAQDAEWSGVCAIERAAIEASLALARSMGARTELLTGSDEVNAILDYARRNHITQLFVGHSLKNPWQRLLSRSTLSRLIRAAEGMDIRIFPNQAAA